MKKVTKLGMEELELLSSVPCSRGGFAEDIRLRTPIILKSCQKSPEAF